MLLNKPLTLKLTQLKVTNFRNYPYADIHFCPRINYFTGANGMGKTNLLDAIYFLCQGKSYFQSNDKQLLLHGQDFLRVEGWFEKNEKRFPVVVKLQTGKKKQILRNNQPVQRLSDFVGELPLVFIAPDDTLLIREGSEARRKFMDSTLSQLYRPYLDALLAYNNLLKQRNQLLKMGGDNRTPDHALLQIYAEQMEQPAKVLYQHRKAFLSAFLPVFQDIYQAISGGHERVQITYQSDLNQEDFLSGIHKQLRKDLILQRTCFGVHRDDFLLDMEDQPVKPYGSQGQVKSFLISLKLAQYHFIRQHKNIAPVLLLDDIFDKLDPRRVDQLLAFILENQFGQIFVTDTHEERMAQIARQLGEVHHAFRVNEGSLTQIQLV